jgi:2-hydroxy-3-keto-5-methylthiopentenyl-1-phosphate phosphatase
VANLICLDFDDTITLDNTARQLFERFAAPGWQELEAKLRAGDLTVEQYNAAALDLVEADETALRNFALEVARLRPGFLELIDWAHWNDWLPVVVSNGFDLYVDTILDAHRLDRVPRHCGRTWFAYRWRVRYDSPRGVELQDGFKLAYARAFRDLGDVVVYVGDGASDVAAARLAPVVFARSTLQERLAGEHPGLYPFETFHDIIPVLEREATRWSASFSSTTPAEG